jgi:DNA-binding response OmpR family regulator
MRIVLADRDLPFLESVQSFLWDRGHEAEIATDALKCLALLRELRPDVLALSSDLLWGGSEGVLAEMRNDEVLQEVPVLLLLGSLTETSLRRHPQVISTARRPFRLDDLTRQIAFLALLCKRVPVKGSLS